MRDKSAEILFQSFLREAIESSSSMVRDVHSLTLSIQHLSSFERKINVGFFLGHHLSGILQFWHDYNLALGRHFHSRSVDLGLVSRS